MFGSTNNNAPAFGLGATSNTTASASLFGGSTPLSTTTTAAPVSTLFGAPAQSGAVAPTFGATATTTPISFTSSTSSKPANLQSSTSVAPSLFGQSSNKPNVSLSKFPATTPALSSAPTFGTAGSSFGAPAATSAATLGAPTSSTSLTFGAPLTSTVQASPKSILTTKPATNAGFGGSTETYEPVGDEVSTYFDVNKPMEFSQFSKILNKTLVEVAEQERKFRLQATELNAYDNVLRNNGCKITDVTNELEKLDRTRNSVLNKISFANEELKHLECGVDDLEKKLGLGDWSASWANGGADIFDSQYKTPADLKRQNILRMLLNVDAQLSDISEGVQNACKEARSLNQEIRGEPDHNEKALTTVLRKHMDVLEWLNKADVELSSKVAQLIRGARQ